MNATHFHLILNHVPVVGILIALGLLLWGLWTREQSVQRAALLIAILVGLAATLASTTGEAAEETVERIAGVSEAAIERHEEAAGLATVAFQLLGLLAFTALLRYRRRALPRRLSVLVLLAGLLPAGAGAWAAFLGGAIRHPEIAPPATHADVPSGEVPGTGARQERESTR